MIQYNFLRALGKINLSQLLLVSFHCCIIECPHPWHADLVWYDLSRNKKAPKRVAKSAQKIINTQMPRSGDLDDIYKFHCLQKMCCLLSNSYHPAHQLFECFTELDWKMAFTKHPSSQWTLLWNHIRYNSVFLYKMILFCAISWYYSAQYFCILLFLKHTLESEWLLVVSESMNDSPLVYTLSYVFQVVHFNFDNLILEYRFRGQYSTTSNSLTG